MEEIRKPVTEPLSTEQVKQQLKESIERDRRAVARTIRHVEREFKKEVTQWIDWREWVRTYPVKAVIGAAFIGFWLGRKF
jgi:ElaB/YqjD/DUF883 family membrane-anchored ribosome-binding protein